MCTLLAKLGLQEERDKVLQKLQPDNEGKIELKHFQDSLSLSHPYSSQLWTSENKLQTILAKIPGEVLDNVFRSGSGMKSATVRDLRKALSRFRLDASQVDKVMDDLGAEDGGFVERSSFEAYLGMYDF